MDDRHICTKDDPWTKEKAPRAQHPDAIKVGSCRDGCCDFCVCPHCRERFTVEYPD